MKKHVLLFLVLVTFSCTQVSNEKIECYAWLAHDNKLNSNQLFKKFDDLKQKGIDVILYSAGHDTALYRFAGKIAKESGLGFHAWIPTMIQKPGPGIDTNWYAVNGLGESALDKPAYVPYYQFLCPNHEGVYLYLEKLYLQIAELPEVDGVHLDYIRFPDVILARGLWDKYGLVMDREYPPYDYCYCEKCVSDFKRKSGINIKEIADPSEIPEWREFRYDLITGLVNRLVPVIHEKNKKITAAVFPGPNSVAKKIVRQEWDQWNVDAFFPMNYNDFYLEGTEWIGLVCKESFEQVGNRKPIYSGLFIGPEPDKSARGTDPENHGLTPEELEEAIRESMENGASGICIFTPDRMTDSHWKSFGKAIFKSYQRTVGN